jgi:hypothetical protein
LLAQVVERGDRFAGHDQDVGRSLRIDIAQGHALIVLVKDLPRLLPVHNLLEQRLLLCHKGQLSGRGRVPQSLSYGPLRLEQERGVGKLLFGEMYAPANTFSTPGTLGHSALY